jgi:hypothetical protein
LVLCFGFWGENFSPGQLFLFLRWNDNPTASYRYVGIVDSTEGISAKKIFLARLSRAADR